ncbi:DNA mismatch repair endonuclease MutL [Desulfatiferula olefinivorans]
MARVRVLPEILSNKIAAGEVVERPGSVVKELVENALDARSSLIAIEIENGGKSLIRVSDNGLGMGRDDALLAVERFATSKIYNDEDLFSIKTLGFRGEALPSIASVSRFSLVSRERTSDIGVGIFIDGGTVRKVRDMGVAPGTVITVEQLFYNTPARRKFLKSTTTEMGHILDTIAGIALGWPTVQFRLSHNGKAVKSWPEAADPYDRAVDVLGREFHNSLITVAFDDGYLSLSGLVSSPDMTRSSAQRIFLFINGRHIKDRRLIHALISAYGSRLMKGRFPVAVLFLTLPFDQLDVNVHPTKHEVRFVDHSRIYTSVQTTVSQALTHAERAVYAVQTPAPSMSTRPDVRPVSTVHPKAFNRPQVFSRAADDDPQAVCEKKPPPFVAPAASDAPARTGNAVGSPDRFTPGALDEKKTGPAAPPREAALWEPSFFKDLRIIGQLHNAYILCESDQGLIIIDQHAAHERVVFEELKNKQGAIARQSLLIPETIEVGYKEAAALSGVLDGLADRGLEIEPFGPNTFAVKAVPAVLSEGMITRLVTEIAEKLVELGTSTALEQALDDCLILMACHGAIRAHQSLSDTQIRHLLARMDACEQPSFCPHGRPTWTRYSLGSIEKAFKR